MQLLQPDFEGMEIKPIKPLKTVLVPSGEKYIGGEYYFLKSNDENSQGRFIFEEVSDEEQEIVSAKITDRRRFKEEEILIREDRMSTFKRGTNTHPSKLPLILSTSAATVRRLKSSMESLIFSYPMLAVSASSSIIKQFFSPLIIVYLIKLLILCKLSFCFFAIMINFLSNSYGVSSLKNVFHTFTGFKN